MITGSESRSLTRKCWLRHESADDTSESEPPAGPLRPGVGLGPGPRPTASRATQGRNCKCQPPGPQGLGRLNPAGADRGPFEVSDSDSATPARGRLRPLASHGGGRHHDSDVAGPSAGRLRARRLRRADSESSSVTVTVTLTARQ